jgi:hypothetical protein
MEQAELLVTQPSERIDCGIVSPRALAVLGLITSLLQKAIAEDIGLLD